MDDLKLSEVQTKKEELQSKICSLLRIFKADTGLYPESVDLVTSENNVGDKTLIRVSIDVKI